MSFMLFTSGEEALLRDFFTEDISKPANVTVGLYNDSADGLGDSDDVGAITTEPSGDSYARQSVSFGDAMEFVLNASQNGQAQFSGVAFDVHDSSNTVDSVFVALNYQRANEGSASDHLLFNAQIDNEGGIDLSSINGTETMNDIALTLD